MTNEQRQKLFNYFYGEFGYSLMDSDFNEIDNILSEPTHIPASPAKTAEDKFIEKHLINVMDLTAEAMIVTRLESMYGGLEMASVSYFIETGKVTGSLYLQVKKMMIDFAERWHSTAALQSQPCQTGYSREDVKKAVDLGLSISTMSDEPFTSAKFRKTKEACIKSFLSSLTNKP
jgi:hypothetical protein